MNRPRPENLSGSALSNIKSHSILTISKEDVLWVQQFVLAIMQEGGDVESQWTYALSSSENPRELTRRAAAARQTTLFISMLHDTLTFGSARLTAQTENAFFISQTSLLGHEHGSTSIRPVREKLCISEIANPQPNLKQEVGLSIHGFLFLAITCPDQGTLPRWFSPRHGNNGRWQIKDASACTRTIYQGRYSPIVNRIYYLLVIL